MDIESQYFNEFDEDDLWVSWSVGSWNEVQVRFDVKVKNSSTGSQDTWLVECDGVRSFSLASTADGSFSVLSPDHALVKTFISPKCQLHCVKGNVDGSIIYSKLVEAHISSVQDWVPIYSYLNTPNFGANILQWQFGVIAEGPTFVLEEYKRSIDDLVEVCNCFGHTNQKDWDGERYIDRPPSVTGICFGKSYVLCDAVTQKMVNQT